VESDKWLVDYLGPHLEKICVDGPWDYLVRDVVVPCLKCKKKDLTFGLEDVDDDGAVVAITCWECGYTAHVGVGSFGASKNADEDFECVGEV
jgi:hypothetical protein